MFRKSLRFGGVLIAAACFVNAAVGQDDYRVAVTTDARESANNADLVARVAALEAQLKNGTSASNDAEGGGCGCGSCGCGSCGCGSCGCGSCGCCSSCGCGCNCDPCCRSEGFYYGAELGFLSPHNSSGVGLNALSTTLGIGPATFTLPLFDARIDPDFEASPRFWVGYQRCDGLGIRARYWEFDHSFDGDVTLLGRPVPGATAFHDWDTWVADVEVTDSTRLGCNWDATFSYGYRHVEYVESRGIDLAGFSYTARKKFYGNGISTSAEFRRQASDTFGLYANVRASILVDDETNSTTFGFPVGPGVSVSINEQQTNDIKYIFETQAGVEYTMPICGGGWYYARAGVEMQYWDNFGVSPEALVFDESAGFAGFTFSAGLMR